MQNPTQCGLWLLAFVALGSLAAAPPALAVTASPVAKVKPVQVPRIIEPGQRLGPVTEASTLINLRGVLGARAVTLEMVQSEDGKTRVSGAVIYPTEAHKRIELAWADTVGKTRPLWARARNAADWWQTASGVRIGTTLVDLERMNGRAFTVQSFRAGERRSQVRSWNKGNLAAELEKNTKIWLAVPTSATKQQMTPLSQGNILPSGDPPLHRLNPHVTEIFVHFVPVL